MYRPRLRTIVFVAASTTTIGGFLACSTGPEQTILNQFFTASRLRDNTTLQNFATVEFDPRRDGTVTSFDIVSVTPERVTALNLKALAKAQADAKAADDEFTKRKVEYENANLDAIRRVLKDEAANNKPKGKDAEVQVAWTKFRSEGAEVSKRVSDARSKLAAETPVVSLSVYDPRTPIDVTKYDGDLASKNIVVKAPVRLASGQTVDKTFDITLQRAILRGDKDITGRWIVTSVKDQAITGATKSSKS